MVQIEDNDTYHIHRRVNLKLNDYDYIDDKSFMPPNDDRVYKSGIDDVYGGDCFADYVEWFWSEYLYDIYDDDIYMQCT